jgi:hypothetical protein
VSSTLRNISYLRSAIGLQTAVTLGADSRKVNKAMMPIVTISSTLLAGPLLFSVVVLIALTSFTPDAMAGPLDGSNLFSGKRLDNPWYRYGIGLVFALPLILFSVAVRLYWLSFQGKIPKWLRLVIWVLTASLVVTAVGLTVIFSYPNELRFLEPYLFKAVMAPIGLLFLCFIHFSSNAVEAFLGFYGSIFGSLGLWWIIEKILVNKVSNPLIENQSQV